MELRMHFFQLVRKTPLWTHHGAPGQATFAAGQKEDAFKSEAAT